MAKRLKELFFTQDSINTFAYTIRKAYANFDKKRFIDLVFDDTFESKELKRTFETIYFVQNISDNPIPAMVPIAIPPYFAPTTMIAKNIINSIHIIFKRFSFINIRKNHIVFILTINNNGLFLEV